MLLRPARAAQRSEAREVCRITPLARTQSERRRRLALAADFRLLRLDYGPDTKEARELLRRSVARAVNQMWSEGRPALAELGPSAESENLYDKIQKLSPQNDAQRSLQAQALRITADLGHMRWLLFEQRGGSIPILFLVTLVFWLVIIFFSFGLFAPQNVTVVATLFVCALSVSGAIFLILDLDRPGEGLIQISSTPLRNALSQLRQ
jgi:hypothetical protein